MRLSIICFCASALGGLASAAALSQERRYSDPVTFCAAVRTTSDIVDSGSDRRYRGPAAPDWMLRAVDVSREAQWGSPVYWRCRGGRVLACVAGMSGLNAQVCFKEFNNGRWDEAIWQDVTPRR
ncbi:MAG TPA: hypothetical protein VFP12_10165 [Allosphingosinicella sp.]|nr:hypothetical protein [Allosphingosinicella sp.]